VQTLVLPYPPSVNHYKLRANGVTFLTAAARAYKAECGLMAMAQAGETFTGPVRVTARFYRPRKAGDLDNRLKVLLDVLNGVVWLDDKQIVEIHAFRHDDKHNPRVEVEVSEVNAW
jgi:crossover junction endodeoxyribonuclease RusA